MRNASLIALSVIVVVICGIAVSGRGDAPEARVRGLVLDENGAPLVGAKVQLRTPNGGCIWNPSEHRAAGTETGADGWFDLPEPPGEMEFYVTHEDHGPAWVAVKDDATIRMPAASYLKLTLNAKATVEIAHGKWQFFRATSDGTLVCGPLPPNVPLNIHVYSPGHRPYFGSVELLADETQTMNVELADGLSVWGTVSPLMEGVKIMAHQTDAHESTATTGPDGSFQLKGLKEGAVRIIAIAPDRPVLVVDTKAGENVELRWK